jgi:hypothetical protein
VRNSVCDCPIKCGSVCAGLSTADDSFNQGHGRDGAENQVTPPLCFGGFSFRLKLVNRPNENEFSELVKNKRKLIRNMKLTIEPLEHDFKYARAQLNLEPSSQFWRRTAIRCLLALAEALLWNLRQIALKAASQLGNQLEQREEEKLLETRRYLKFPESVKLTLSSFGEAYGFVFEPKCDEGFEALCKTYERRNDLMHPKRPFDINIFDDACTTAWKGADWLLKEYWSLIAKTEEAVEKMRIPKH